MTRLSSIEAPANFGFSRTLPSILIERARISPDAPAQWWLDANGQWRSVSYSQYLDNVRKLSLALSRLGLNAEERVGIMAPSTVRWDYASLAVMGARGVVVGIDQYGTTEQLAQIVQCVNLQALVLGDASYLARFPVALLPSLKFVLVLSGSAETVREQGLAAYSVEQLIQSPEEVESTAWNRAVPDDPAIVIFTSGTTGTPKGMLYRHRQVMMAIDGILQAFDEIAEGSRLICWLPLANIFQRVINLCSVAKGGQTYYLEDPRQIVEYLPRLEPHVFIGVPRFYEKLYEGILANVSKRGAVVRGAVTWAIRVGDTHARARRAGATINLGLATMHWLAERLVLEKVRAAVCGSAMRYVVSGSAPMPMWLLEAFDALGILVLEGYAMSECMIPVATNRPGAYRFGSVGQPMPGNEIRLAADGEILLRGPGVCDAYLGEDSGTPPIDSDGFLATGDLAEMAADGFIRLTGRKSEVFKTSTGRRVAPSGVEAVLKRLPHVSDAAVYGAARKSLSAVLWITDEAPGREPGSSVAPKGFAHAIHEVLLALPAYLRPTGFVLTRRPFGIASGELTANLKLRRDAVVERYRNELERLYHEMDAHAAGVASYRNVEADQVELLLL